MTRLENGQGFPAQQLPTVGGVISSLPYDPLDEVGARIVAFWVDDEPRHLQSTGFALAPDGTVLTAVYSSGAIGRLLPDDVIGLVKHAKQHS